MSAPPEIPLPVTESENATALPDPAFEERVAAYETNVLPADYDFDAAFSVDENYMILALIYARLSVSKRGNMACIIVEPESEADAASVTVRPADPNGSASDRPIKRARIGREVGVADDEANRYSRYPGRVLAHSNNTPLPIPEEANVKITNPRPLKKGHTARKEIGAGQSAFQRFAGTCPEIHAEARAICLAASSSSLSLRGTHTTAYITFPPCKECLPLLLAIGIKRLVYRQTATPVARTLCRLAGIECVEFTDREHDDRLKEHVKAWWTARGEGKEETRARVERWWIEAEKQLAESEPAVAAENGSSGEAEPVATSTAPSSTATEAEGAAPEVAA
ncbi:hypothetical protein JCM10908_006537 [Rhodotorula pacifica]|uniref:uncharacterized protein n=1 Tax=Rhodotorula pacifica TaxID=1495444 RepID=UPI0031795307